MFIHILYLLRRSEKVQELIDEILYGGPFELAVQSLAKLWVTEAPLFVLLGE